MARYGCTITVDTGEMPSSQTNFGWVATEDNFPTGAIDGGATSILNGGGNLRCYTDDTKATQLPIEVLEFVTGGTPAIQVSGLSPTLNVASTVYIEADTVAISQPAVTDTYGRNSVWVDKNLKVFATSSSPVDSTGVHTVTAFGSPVSDGESILFNGTTQYLSTASATAISNKSIFSGYVTFTPSGGSVADALLFKRGSSNKGYAFEYKNDTGLLRLTFLGVAGYNSTSSVTLSGKSFVRFTVSGTQLNFYADGVKLGNTVTTSSSRLTTTKPLLIGATSDASGNITGYNTYRLYNSELSDLIYSADYITSEYNNQSSPSTFWSTGLWEDQDAGGGRIMGSMVHLGGLVGSGGLVGLGGGLVR